jgi:hypothetical protein
MSAVDEGWWMFSMSDFAWFLKCFRDQWYPYWNLFVFADYFLTHHRIRWTRYKMLEFGECLGQEESLSTYEGVVRSSFLKLVEEEDMIVTYTDLVTRKDVHAFNMFDRRHIGFQAVFFSSFVNGLARRVVEATPVEFQKSVTLNVVHGPTNTTWNTFSNINNYRPTKHRMAEVKVTMVVVDEEDHGIEKHTSYVRYVSGIGAHHIDLNESVVGVFETDTCVYFECDIPWVGACVRYMGYRVVPLARDDVLAYEVSKVICPTASNEHDDILLQIRRFFLGLKRIQRRWRVCVSDPAYLVCRRRLLREWKELI